MPIFGQSDDHLVISERETPKLLEQKSKYKNDQPNLPELTNKQQLKQDAMDLAELIYDIFQDSLSSANMEEKGQ